jgi:hypothetical protein
MTYTFIYTSSRFAYVDFATPGGKQVAITMSEQNLDGRRLLIKDGKCCTATSVAISSHIFAFDS